MSEYLVIRLGADAQEMSHWIVVDSSGARRGPPGSGTLDEASAEIDGREVIVLVPSAEVLTTTVDIPVRGGARLQAALPYALEEFLADDIDRLHFAAGSKRSGGQTPVSIVNRERMAQWLAMLDEAGIQPSSVVADSYGLARIPGTISLLLAENQVFINDGSDVELVMQGVSPGDALAAIGALDDGDEAEDDGTSAAGSLPRHVLVYCDADDEEKFQHDWIAIRQELDSVDVRILADGVLPRLAVTIATGAGINLLQGDFAAKREYGGLFRPWKYAAMLVLAFGLIGMATKATDYYLLVQQETELRQTFNDEYRQMLPGAVATDDPARVVDSLRRRVGIVGSVPVFLQTMEQLSQALQQNDEARIEAISYRSGVVDIRITAPNFGVLDSLQRAIVERGQFSAAIQSTDQDGEIVSSRIQIRPSGT